MKHFLIENIETCFYINHSESYLFDEEITRDNITKWKDKYFPATLYYLEKKYGLPIELEYDKSKTGLEYLIEKLNIEKNSKIILGEIETKKWKVKKPKFKI